MRAALERALKDAAAQAPRIATLREGFAAVCRRYWANLERDVWADPTITPYTALLLCGLAGLIVWLSATYSPEAITRATYPRASGEDAISPGWGWVTIGSVAIITLLTGFEPALERRRHQWWKAKGRASYRSLRPSIRRMVWFSGVALLSPAYVMSVILSFGDFLLARVVAIVAGVGWGGWAKRYLHFVGVMAVVVIAIIWCSPRNAAAAVIGGLFAILAVVRRWSWVESDRATFLIERGERKAGRGSIRIGFREDLRDEALFALVWLFVLIPSGLNLAQEISCASGACAFGFDAPAPVFHNRVDQYIAWAGYFGAELAKAVPFVDWSEVFHVANGSPLKPLTPLGSQLEFILRAGLDLLFLAAVLQAVQIATRLRNQEEAFNANRLPILEPFSERIKLQDLAETMDDDLGIRPSAHPAVAAFPWYQPERLMEIVEGGAAPLDLPARKAAAALLQSQFEETPERSSDTANFWTRRVNSGTGEHESDLRAFVLGVASGLDPDEPIGRSDVARRERLLTVAQQDWADPQVRTFALQALGRTQIDQEGCARILTIVRNRTAVLNVRAAAAVTLAKMGEPGFVEAIGEFASDIPDTTESIGAAMSAAYALTIFGLLGDEVAQLFRPNSLLPHVVAATQIQVRPIGIRLASVRQRGASTNQMVEIAPGSDGFPPAFDMGSKRDEEGSEAPERPMRRAVKMNRSFAIGRFTVTNGEYSTYLRATGTDDVVSRGSFRTPATWLSWFEAMAYCRWLNGITGEQYRLPTEAEWEYACRAGAQTRYSWGDEWDNTKARSNETKPNGRSKVGAYRPNAFGIWDMHGNVYEWCADPWHLNYRGHPPTDESPWIEDADCTLRVIRGGSGSSAPNALRSAFRYGEFPTFRYHYVGFRLARTL